MALRVILGSIRWMLVAFGALAPALQVRSQNCHPHWLAGEPFAAANGAAQAMTVWDPDGSGPMTPKLVVGGSFKFVGAKPANRIAAWDPAAREWTNFGAGFDNRVTALAVLPNGDLVAGGSFSFAGDVRVNRIARWNRTAGEWEALGSGIATDIGTGVFAIAGLPNGDIVAGGSFTIAGTSPGFNIARWSHSTSTWSPLGVGLNGTVAAIASMPNGDVIAGGHFTQAGGVSARGIAIWKSDSASWSPMGDLGIYEAVEGVCFDSEGVLHAYKTWRFSPTISFAIIIRWDQDSQAWLPIGGTGDVDAMIMLPNDDIVVGGRYGNIRCLEAATGAWSDMGEGLSTNIFAMAALPSGKIVAGGAYVNGNDPPEINLAAWDEATSLWEPIVHGFNGPVYAILQLRNGDRIVGGNFTRVGSVEASNIARWNQSTGEWTPLGIGCSHAVHTLLEMPDGRVVAGGGFYYAGGLDANFVARWDSLTEEWSVLAGGVGGTVRSLLLLNDGRLAVGGSFNWASGDWAGNIVIWDESSATWLRPGGGVDNESNDYDPVINTMVQLPNGDLIVGGRFSSAGGVSAPNMARWSTTSQLWSSVVAGFAGEAPEVHAFAWLPNGELVVAGKYLGIDSLEANAVARWNPTTNAWSSLSLGPNTEAVFALLTTPDGGVIAGGNLQAAEDEPTRHIAQWIPTSQTWAPLAADPNADVMALATRSTSELIAGGYFTLVGEAHTASFARYSLDALPWVTVHPQPATLEPGEDLVLSATPAFGYSGVTAQWFRDGVALADGDAGCTGGSVISGSSFTFPDPTDGTPAELRISYAQASDSGSYSVVFANACGQVTSEPAVVLVGQRCAVCPADFDSDGGVTCADVAAFIAEYEAGEGCADVDNNGGVDGGDLAYFFSVFEAGGC